MKIREFVEKMVDAFKYIGVECDSYEIIRDADIVDDFKNNIWSCMTGKRDIHCVRSNSNEGHLASIYLKYDSSDLNSFRMTLVILAHMNWFKTTIQHIVRYGFKEDAAYMFDGMICACIEYHDIIALENTIAFDVEGFVKWYNGQLEPYDMGRKLELFGEYSNIIEAFPEDMTWFKYCNSRMEYWLKKCDEYNSNNCKAMLLRWKKEHGFDDETEEIAL